MDTNEPYPIEVMQCINRFLDRIEQVLLTQGTSRAERTSICAEVESQIHTMIERKLEAGAQLNLELVNGIIESMDPPESYAPSAEPAMQSEPVLQAESISAATKESAEKVLLGYVRKIWDRPKRTKPQFDWVAICGPVVTLLGILLVFAGMRGRHDGTTLIGFLMIFAGVAGSGISFWRIRNSNGLLTGQAIASAGMLMLPLLLVNGILSVFLFASPFGRFLGAIVLAAALLYVNYRMVTAAMHWLTSYSAKAPEEVFAKAEKVREATIEPGPLSGVTT